MAALKPGNHRIGRHEGKAVRSAGGLAATLLALLAAGCAAAPLDEAGSLASYNDLKPSDGLLTRSLVAVSKDRVLAAKTIKIAPTAFSAPAVREPLTPAQRHLVVNAVDRALCEGLSERFEVVGPSELGRSDRARRRHPYRGDQRRRRRRLKGRIGCCRSRASGRARSGSADSRRVGQSVARSRGARSGRRPAGGDDLGARGERGRRTRDGSPPKGTPTTWRRRSARTSANSSSQGRRRSASSRRFRRSTTCARRLAESRNMRPARRLAFRPASSDFSAKRSGSRLTGPTKAPRRQRNEGALLHFTRGLAGFGRPRGLRASTRHRQRGSTCMNWVGILAIIIFVVISFLVSCGAILFAFGVLVP